MKFCEDHKIKATNMLPHTTHLFQLFNVYVFQLLKHCHSEVVNKVVKNGNKTFSRIEFFNAFNTFAAKLLKNL